MNSKRSIGILSLLLLLVGALSVVPAAAIHATTSMSPRLILTAATVDEGALPAGETAKLTLTLKNTHPSEYVQNVMLTLSATGEQIYPAGTGSHYISRIDAGADYTWTTEVRATDSAKGGMQMLSLSFACEDRRGIALSGSESVYLEVRPAGTTGKTTVPPMSPRLMLTDYSVQDAAPSVGESGTLQLTVKNMHPDEEVRNVRLSLDSTDGAVLPSAAGSTFVERIPAAQEVVWDCAIQALASAAPGVYPLTLTIEYEDVQGTSLSSNETVYIEVTQVPRLEFGHLTVSPRVQQGELAQLSLNVMNLGKGPVHNVLLTLNMDGLADGFSELVGQLESGESRQASMNIPVSQSVEPGTVEGTLLLSYESPAGAVYEESFELSTVVVEREDLDPLAEDASADDGLIPRWWLIPAGAAVLVLLVLYIIQSQRLRRIKEEEAARL